jgi:hypothetical protein
VQKWLAGVAAAVVATVITAFVTDWFGLGGERPSDDRESAPAQAVARITAFNQSGSRVGEQPEAEITVENQGTTTAENCVVHWKSGIVFTAGVPQEVPSEEFPLQAGETSTVSLSAPATWTRGGLMTATAWVACSNTESPVQEKSLLVFAS